jgi:hypothetical protein
MLEFTYQTWDTEEPTGEPEKANVVEAMGVHVRLSARFEKRDLWVGCYWNRSDVPRHALDLYLCPLPCCLLHLTIEEVPTP